MVRTEFETSWIADNARHTLRLWNAGYRVASLFGPPPTTECGIHVGGKYSTIEEALAECRRMAGLPNAGGDRLDIAVWLTYGVGGVRRHRMWAKHYPNAEDWASVGVETFEELVAVLDRRQAAEDAADAAYEAA